MEYTQDMRESEDIRNNKLYNRVMQQMIYEYRQNLEVNDASDHLGFVQAQAAISALRILNDRLMHHSEPRD